MEAAMNAEHVMTRDVISIDPDATVLQAARLMRQHHSSGLPVIDKDGNFVGVLSEGDFLRRRETKTERRRSRWLEFLMGPGRIAAEYSHSHGSKVSEVMTTAVQTVDEVTPLQARSGGVWRPGCRDRHALQPDARHGQPGARGAGPGRGRHRHPRAAIG